MPKTEKLVSLGTLCAPASQILYIREQKGIVSPFSWQKTTPEIVLNILQDDFVTLLNKDKYAYNIKDGLTHFHSHTNTSTSSGLREYLARRHEYGPLHTYEQFNELIVAEPGYHLVFPHTDPLKNLNDYEKLKAQCAYLKACLNTDSGFGYIMNILGPYEYHADTLIGIREMIPEDCKFFVCLMKNKQDFEPELNKDNIYYGAFDIGDHTKRLMTPSARSPKLNFLEKWKPHETAHAYGMAEEYTKMIDKIFYS